MPMPSREPRQRKSVETVTKAGASFRGRGNYRLSRQTSWNDPALSLGEPGIGSSRAFFRKHANARAIGPNPGAASALKVVYAAWTKCTDGLVLAIRALAAIEGVDQALSEEWSISQPDLARKSARAAAVAAPKAWRYVGEMKEIAESFAAAGLTPGFHDAAADIWQRLAPFKDRTDPPPTLEEVIDALCRSCDKLR